VPLPESCWLRCAASVNIDHFAMHWTDPEVEQEDAKRLIFSSILLHPACSTALPSAARGRGGAVEAAQSGRIASLMGSKGLTALGGSRAEPSPFFNPPVPSRARRRVHGANEPGPVFGGTMNIMKTPARLVAVAAASP
jgi:hypothetical protein